MAWRCKIGTIFDKLAYTKQAREEIRQAIVEKGVNCPGHEAFCAFDDYIRSIQGGGDVDLSSLVKLIGDGKILNGDNWQSLDEIIALVGGDTTSVEKQLLELISLSNKTTGNKDDTLTESIEALVDGYGQGGSKSNSFHFHQREKVLNTDIKMMPDPCNGIIHPRPIIGIIGRYKLLVQEVQQ